MRRVIFLAIAIVALLVGPVSSALAAPPAVDTDVVVRGTDTFPEVNPCSGAPGTVSVTFNAVFHITAESDFVYHISGATTGTFAFVPNSRTEPSFSGRFVNAFSEQATPPGLGFVYTNTFTVIGTGSDGSRLRFHLTEHVTRLPSGQIVVAFTNVACG